MIRRFNIRFLTLVLVMLTAGFAEAQLDENCMVTILNRVARVQPNGQWAIANVPASAGRVRARATCQRNGVTTIGQSEYFVVPPNGVIDAIRIVFDDPQPVPARIDLTAPEDTPLNAIGATRQLTATVTLPNGTTQNVSDGPATGTNFRSSNVAIATVSDTGLVTAVGSGAAIISATNEGTLALLRVLVSGSADADGDGMPDEWETANGFDPGNAADAGGDADDDGLTNVAEYTQGTNPRDVDSDGDGVTDGVEVQTGSSPMNPDSFNLAAALTSIAFHQPRIVLTHTPLTIEVTRQLQVLGTLLDGRTIDLTSRSTNYSSGDLDIVTFASADGLLTAGNNGATTITATNNGFSATAQVVVTTHNHIAISSTWLPSTITGVDIVGDLAYVTAGGKLTIIDITHRDGPVIRGSITVAAETADVRVRDNIAYVAASSEGVVVVDISNADAPAVVTTFDTPGAAVDLAVSGTHLYVADSGAGLRVLDISTPTSPQAAGDLAFDEPAHSVAISGMVAIVLTTDMLHTIDVQNPAIPLALGSAWAVRGLEVTAVGSYAYVAAYTSGFRLFDFSNPAAPVMSAGVSGQFFPVDVVASNGFAFFADELFVNAIPVVDVRVPSDPQYRAALNLSNFGDPDGTAIDVDNSFAYLGAGLQFLIARHTPLLDEQGVAPTISFVSPDASEVLVSSGQQRITLQAADDVGINSVTVTLNGMRIPDLERYPYSAEVFVPNIAAKFVATVKDFGGASATATRTYQVSSGDPGTTVTGRVLTQALTPAIGAEVRMENDVTNQTLTTTDANGVYRIENVATAAGDVQAHATYTVGTQKIGKLSPLVTPIRTGDTVMPDLILGQGLTVTLSSTRAGDTVLGGESIPIRVDFTNDSNDEHVILELFIDGANRGRLNQDSDANPFRGTFTVPEGDEEISLVVRANDSRTSGYLESAPITFNVIPDPGTIVTGRVVDAGGNPVEGAVVDANQNGLFTTTDANGVFRFENAPSVSVYELSARKLIGSVTYSGLSQQVMPVRSGTTTIPDIQLGSGPMLTITSPESSEPTLVHNQPIAFTINGTTDPGVEFMSVQVLATGMPFTQQVGPLPATMTFTVPDGITSYTIDATATDTRGNDLTTSMSWTVTADPLSTVSGTVKASNGAPVAGAIVSLRPANSENLVGADGTYLSPLGTLQATTDAEGDYTLTNVPTNRGQLIVRATKLLGTDGAAGESAALRPVRGGTTNVPDVTVNIPTAVTSQIAVDTFANAIDVHDRRMAIGNGGSVHLFDFANPARPQLRDTLVLGEWTWLNVIHFYDNGNRVALITDEPKLYIADVTNLDAPAILGELELDGWPTSAVLNGSILAIASDDLILVDISNAAAPSITGRLTLPRGAHHLGLAGNLVIVAEKTSSDLTPPSGVSVVDISNPAQPALVGRVPQSDAMGPLVIHGTRAYFTGTNELHMLDFTNPASPVVTRNVTALSPLETWSIGKTGTRVFVSGAPNGAASIATIELASGTPVRGDNIAAPEWGPFNAGLISLTSEYLVVAGWPDEGNPNAPLDIRSMIYVIRIPEPAP